MRTVDSIYMQLLALQKLQLRLHNLAFSFKFRAKKSSYKPKSATTIDYKLLTQVISINFYPFLHPIIGLYTTSRQGNE